MFRTLLRTNPLARSSTRFFASSRPVLNTTHHLLNKQSRVAKYLNEGPKSVKYTAEHEWLAIFNDDTAFVGITKYASEALGDVTFVELPEVGDRVDVGDTIGSVESVKSASDIYSPVEGEVIAINDVLESEPQLINNDPIGDGWIAQIKLSSPKTVEEADELLTVEAYEESLSEQ